MTEDLVTLDADLCPLDPPLDDINDLEAPLALASLYLAGFDVCSKCNKSSKARQDAIYKMREVRRILRLTQETLFAEYDRRRSDWRHGLRSDLDKFARLMLENDSASLARRVIFDALKRHQERLRLLSKLDDPREKYTHAKIELGHVSYFLLELWDYQGTESCGMTSGGTHCDVCRKRNEECRCLPEPIEHSAPACPWCGLLSDATEDGTRSIRCAECGGEFEATRKVVFRSRPVKRAK